MERKLGANTLLNLLGNVVPVAAGVACLPILVRQLGTELFGILTILWVIIGYFSLFDLGVGRALTQLIAARRTRENEAAIIKAGLILTVFTGLLAGVVFALLAEVLTDSVLNVSATNRQDVFLGLLISSMGVPITTVSAGLRGALEGYERFIEVNIAKSVLGTSLVTFPLLAILSTDTTMEIVAWSLVAARGAGLLLYATYLNKFVKLTKITAQKVEKEKFKEIAIFGGWMTITNIVSPILVNADRFIISSLLGAGVVAYYTLPFEIVTRLLVVASAVGAALLPRISKEFAIDKQAADALVKKVSVALTVLLAPAFLIVLAFGNEILLVFGGAEFQEQSYYTLVFLTAGVIFNSAGYIFYTALHALKQAKQTACLHLAEGFLYIPLLLLSITKYGIDGASASWAIRCAADAGFIVWIYAKRVKNV